MNTTPGDAMASRAPTLAGAAAPTLLPAGGLPGARLRRVIAHVDANLHRTLTLTELSAVVHMSPYHFARLFKRSTSVSPHHFLLCRRIERAKMLLASGAEPVECVARTVGFSTASHFTTTFRRLVGLTPTAYRGSTRCVRDDAHARPGSASASMAGTGA